MKDKILKWWNRTWSNWSYYTYAVDFGYRYNIYSRISNDGIVEFKKVKII